MSIETIKKTEALQDIISVSVKNYLSENSTNSLYDFILEQIEPPLLDAVMMRSKYNQVRAAKMLGISRGNLRKKITHYFDDKYCQERASE